MTTKTESNTEHTSYDTGTAGIPRELTAIDVREILDRGINHSKCLLNGARMIECDGKRDAAPIGAVPAERRAVRLRRGPGRKTHAGRCLGEL